MLELIISAAIFVLVAMACAYIGTYGFSMFNHTNTRQILQRDARAVMGWVKRDISVSNLNMLQVDSTRTSPNSQPRHALGIPNLESWRSPIATNHIGLPAWDQFVVYLATREERGQLFRQVVTPPSSYLPFTEARTADLLRESIAGSVALDEQRRLSSSIRTFEADISIQNDLVHLNMILETDARTGGSNTKRKEVLQIETAVYPHNTWPRN